MVQVGYVFLQNHGWKDTKICDYCCRPAHKDHIGLWGPGNKLQDFWFVDMNVCSVPWCMEFQSNRYEQKSAHLLAAWVCILVLMRALHVLECGRLRAAHHGQVESDGDMMGHLCCKLDALTMQDCKVVMF